MRAASKPSMNGIRASLTHDVGTLRARGGDQGRAVADRVDRIFRGQHRREIRAQVGVVVGDEHAQPLAARRLGRPSRQGRVHRGGAGQRAAGEKRCRHLLDAKRAAARPFDRGAPLDVDDGAGEFFESGRQQRPGCTKFVLDRKQTIAERHIHPLAGISGHVTRQSPEQSKPWA